MASLTVIAPLFIIAGLSASAAPASAAAVDPPPLPAPTTLQASSVSILHTVTTLRVTYSARLVNTATGAPVPGQYILFSDTSIDPGMNPLANLVCEPMTNANGVASCSVQIGYLLNGLFAIPAYTATFFGTPQFGSSTATALVALT